MNKYILFITLIDGKPVRRIQYASREFVDNKTAVSAYKQQITDLLKSYHDVKCVIELLGHDIGEISASRDKSHGMDH
ncbi:MAG: hypothetical protein Q7R33_09675 [Nitrosarchaeum sp.]|nr:hypothetical protein [Nitrosarchaeum sp.]